MELRKGSKVKPSAAMPRLDPNSKLRIKGTFLRRQRGHHEIVAIKWDGIGAVEYLHEDFIERLQDDAHQN